MADVKALLDQLTRALDPHIGNANMPCYSIRVLDTAGNVLEPPADPDLATIDIVLVEPDREYNRQLAEQIRQAAENPEPPQAEIAAEVGISQQRVSQITSPGTSKERKRGARVDLSAGTDPTAAAEPVEPTDQWHEVRGKPADIDGNPRKRLRKRDASSPDAFNKPLRYR